MARFLTLVVAFVLLWITCLSVGFSIPNTAVSFTSLSISAYAAWRLLTGTASVIGATSVIAPSAIFVGSLLGAFLTEEGEDINSTLAVTLATSLVLLDVIIKAFFLFVYYFVAERLAELMLKNGSDFRLAFNAKMQSIGFNPRTIALLTLGMCLLAVFFPNGATIKGLALGHATLIALILFKIRLSYCDKRPPDDHYIKNATEAASLLAISFFAPVYLAIKPVLEKTQNRQ